MSLENSKKKTKDRLLTVTGRHVGRTILQMEIFFFYNNSFSSRMLLDADRPRCDSNLVYTLNKENRHALEFVKVPF